MRKKFFWANQGQFMTKELNKAIMTRSISRYIYLYEKSAGAEITYHKQRNYCVWISYVGPKIIILLISTSVQYLIFIRSRYLQIYI